MWIFTIVCLFLYWVCWKPGHFLTLILAVCQNVSKFMLIVRGKVGYANWTVWPPDAPGAQWKPRCEPVGTGLFQSCPLPRRLGQHSEAPLAHSLPSLFPEGHRNYCMASVCSGHTGSVSARPCAASSEQEDGLCKKKKKKNLNPINGKIFTLSPDLL